MYSDLFSKRYGLRPTPAGLLYEEVPDSARVGLYHVLEHFFYDQRNQQWSKCSKLYYNICIALRIPRKRNISEGYEASMVLEHLIMNCEWSQFYDICEVMWSNIDYSATRDELSAHINSLFGEEQLGFELRNGKVEKVGSGFVDSRIKEARYLLTDPEFQGADKQFEKAIRAINVRPSADVENCIKDAVAAIESVGRIIVNKDKALLSDIIKDLVNKGIIPRLLGDIIQKIYAYRGDEPGVTHGLVGDSKVTIDEAELVLAMSAATIMFLIKKGEIIKII